MSYVIWPLVAGTTPTASSLDAVVPLEYVLACAAETPGSCHGLDLHGYGLCPLWSPLHVSFTGCISAHPYLPLGQADIA